MHHKSEFCSTYLEAYENDWINRQKMAKSRTYYGNFDLFAQIGTAISDTINTLLPNPERGYEAADFDSLYMYRVNWADSFYLYHYRSPYLVERCVCDMYDASYTDSFELERPLWKFYKINDTTYFSTRLVLYTRDSFLHTPNQILWKRNLQNRDSLGNFSQRYENERKKKKPFIYTYRLIRQQMPKDLFWQMANNRSPKLATQVIPRFSMDSLIRSFQK